MLHSSWLRAYKSNGTDAEQRKADNKQDKGNNLSSGTARRTHFLDGWGDEAYVVMTALNIWKWNGQQFRKEKKNIHRTLGKVQNESFLGRKIYGSGEVI